MNTFDSITESSSCFLSPVLKTTAMQVIIMQALIDKYHVDQSGSVMNNLIDAFYQEHFIALETVQEVSNTETKLLSDLKEIISKEERHIDSFHVMQSTFTEVIKKAAQKKREFNNAV